MNHEAHVADAAETRASSLIRSIKNHSNTREIAAI